MRQFIIQSHPDKKGLVQVEGKDFHYLRQVLRVKAGDMVEAGRPLANIINPYEGNIIETLYSPINGIIFFIHNEPITYANTAVIKLIEHA